MDFVQVCRLLLISITILCVSFTNSATVGRLEQVQLCNRLIDQSADNITGLKCAKECLILKYKYIQNPWLYFTERILRWAHFLRSSNSWLWTKTAILQFWCYCFIYELRKLCVWIVSTIEHRSDIMKNIFFFTFQRFGYHPGYHIGVAWWKASTVHLVGIVS